MASNRLKNEYGKGNYLLKNIPVKYKSEFAKFRF
jgi:hypothetical protein